MDSLPYKEFDYYRSDVDGQDAISYQLILMDDELKTWHRSDDAIHGTWSEMGGKFYLNFDHPEEDRWNSGIYKGFRIFKKIDAEPEYWECIKPDWNPSTKMIKIGTTPPWGKDWAY